MESLANRIRPDKLSDFIGQFRLTEKERLLYLTLQKNTYSFFILWSFFSWTYASDLVK